MGLFTDWREVTPCFGAPSLPRPALPPCRPRQFVPTLAFTVALEHQTGQEPSSKLSWTNIAFRPPPAGRVMGSREFPIVPRSTGQNIIPIHALGSSGRRTEYVSYYGLFKKRGGVPQIRADADSVGEKTEPTGVTQRLLEPGARWSCCALDGLDS